MTYYEIYNNDTDTVVANVANRDEALRIFRSNDAYAVSTFAPTTDGYDAKIAASL